MRISVIGSGYVGLVTGVCLADTGNHVVGVDIDAEKVETILSRHLPKKEHEETVSDQIARSLGF